MCLKPLKRLLEQSKPRDTVLFSHHSETRWESPDKWAIPSSHDLPHIYGLLRK